MAFAGRSNGHPAAVFSVIFSARSIALSGALGAPDPGDEIAESTNSIIDTVADAVPRVATAAVIVLVGYAVSRLIRYVLHRVFSRSQTPSFARVMSKLSGWVFLAVIVLLAIAVTFPSVKPVDLLAGLGFFSVAVGFAFQDILENTLAGMLLLFRQPFESGDQIEVQGQTGTVERITIRETQIKAYGGEHVIIPNRDVYKSVIVVATHYPQRRQEFVIGIAYENDADEATRVIADALASIDGVQSDPEPVAFVDQLGVSTVDIAALFWTDSRRLDSRRIRDSAITNVKRRLEEAGIEMPADIIALQATPSFRAALADADVTPGGSVVDPGAPG